MPEVNQQLIADRLSISRATVSRCFTNHAGISPVTRAKVFQLAAELGYTHMENRKPAKKKKARARASFQVLICSDADEYFSGGYESPGEQILAGVSEYAQSHDFKVEVNLIPPSAVSLEDAAFENLELFAKRTNHGVLLIYPFPEPVIDQLALRFPLVSLVDQLEHNSIDCVDVDHYAGISSAVEHLVDAGHQRIGFYTKDYPVEASWSFRRYSAFMEKMARLKLKVQPKDVIGIFPRIFGSEEARFEEAVARSQQGVTAWICAADHQAYDLIRALKKAGMKVPREVSVTGFDGIEKRKSSPALTTIEIPYREIGITGAGCRSAFTESVTFTSRGNCVSERRWEVQSKFPRLRGLVGAAFF